MKNINPTTTSAWKSLQTHYDTFTSFNLREAFRNDDARVEKHSITLDDFYVDFSKNLIDEKTVELLIQLANECDLQSAIESYFNGTTINATENKAVLHTALRTPAVKASDSIKENVTAATASKQKMYDYIDAIHNGDTKTYEGKKFDTIVNIGIGGSNLGPVMIYEALQAYKNDLTVHFISNVEGDHVEEVLKKINPSTTLFVIVSKSFGTQETLTNATTIRNWFAQNYSNDAISSHFIAVSSNVKKAVDFGIDVANIFPMFDWVGGRFSLWSTVGMSIALGVGTQNFQSLLDGAYAMDQHFTTASFKDNIPVQLALLSVWYNNFHKAQSEAIIPYTEYLHRLPAYLQQAIMESNGKSVDRNGNPINYETGNIVWGEPGTNSQHAFFQLIHQGTKLIPAHFIAFAKAKYDQPDHHNKLMANYLAQTEALMNGKTADEVKADLIASGKSAEEIKQLLPFKVLQGNKPTTSILIDELTPASIGKLVAMYEHKIFVEGVIWNIYSYDQWGVELGKVLADAILNELETGKMNSHDQSTVKLISMFRNKIFTS